MRHPAFLVNHNVNLLPRVAVFLKTPQLMGIPLSVEHCKEESTIKVTFRHPLGALVYTLAVPPAGSFFSVNDEDKVLVYLFDKNIASTDYIPIDGGVYGL